MRNTCIIPSCHQDIILVPWYTGHLSNISSWVHPDSNPSPVIGTRVPHAVPDVHTQMVTDSLIYTLTYAGQSVTRNFACAMPVYTRILACIMSVRVHLCSYACMRNAFRWAPHPPTQPHNSLSDRPPEIYVPTPPLNGSVSSLYIHTHIQVLGMVCNTTSTCTQIEDCERRGHFHFSRRHCWSPEWNIPHTPFHQDRIVQSKDNGTYPTWYWGIHRM